MESKIRTKAQPKKSFNWGISSTSISFMHTKGLETARDGSACDCANLSPQEQPKQKPPRRVPGKV